LSAFLKTGRQNPFPDLGRLFLSPHRVIGHVEPYLKNVRNRQTVTQNRSAEDRLSLPGYSQVNVWPLVGIPRGQSKLPLSIGIWMFQVEMRQRPLNKSVAQQFSRSEESNADIGHGIARNRISQ
jgi:hypothetical protein